MTVSLQLKMSKSQLVYTAVLNTQIYDAEKFVELMECSFDIL